MNEPLESVCERQTVYESVCVGSREERWCKLEGGGCAWRLREAPRFEFHDHWRRSVSRFQIVCFFLKSCGGGGGCRPATNVLDPVQAVSRGSTGDLLLCCPPELLLADWRSVEAKGMVDLRARAQGARRATSTSFAPGLEKKRAGRRTVEEN